LTRGHAREGKVRARGAENDRGKEFMENVRDVIARHATAIRDYESV
jgi:hypothetical protein